MNDMDEEKRKKLVERRKREQKKKELQVDLHRDLKLEDKRNEEDELRGQFENIWTAAIYSAYRRRSVLEDLIDLFY